MLAHSPLTAANYFCQFHRVREYVKLEPEEKADESYEEEGAYLDDDAEVISKLWPRTGEVEFRDVTIRYDPEGPNILTDINLKFKAGQRVAIIGRTGSGKSTVSTAIFGISRTLFADDIYSQQAYSSSSLSSDSPILSQAKFYSTVSTSPTSLAAASVKPSL